MFEEALKRFKNQQAEEKAIEEFYKAPESDSQNEVRV